MSESAEDLMPQVYEELKRLASKKLAIERPGHTLQTTALVHEVYLRLTSSSSSQAWDHRGHFFGAAAEAMRRILIESARRKAARKHGGGEPLLPIDEALLVADHKSEDLIHLDEALADLERHSPEAAGLVKLRYFAGMSHGEAAETLNISRRAADRLWLLARTWLYREISGDQSAK